MGMIGSHYWRNKRHGLNKCDEGGREHCSDHADCCAVTACTYCFELEIYGEAVQKVSSNRTDNHWTGTVGNVLFDMYWDRDYDTDECVLIVEANGEEVYRKSCYEGQSCRDSSDEAAITVDYEDAILRWVKHESRPLPHRIDPNTGCKVWFCGECECSCRELCVTVTDPEGAIAKGELSDVSYDDCEGPVWAGTVGEYELELALSWDIYDQCVLLVKVDGEEQDAVAVTGCKDLSATIELYDGTTITVSCKQCACDQSEPPVVTCADCEDTFPSEVSVLIPSLGISDTALLTSSGDNDFLYSWEGSDGTYSWQADFACTNLNFAIAKGDLTYACTADNGPPTTVTIEIVSCYPDPLQIVYTFECLQGGSLTVVLAE